MSDSSGQSRDMSYIVPLAWATVVILLLSELILIGSSYVITNTVILRRAHRNPVWMSRVFAIILFSMSVALDFVDVNPALPAGVCEFTNFVSIFSLWLGRFFVSSFYILRYEAIQKELKAPTPFKIPCWIINCVMLFIGFINSVLSRRVVNGKCTSHVTVASGVIVALYLLLNIVLQVSLLYLFLKPISNHLKTMKESSVKTANSSSTEDMKTVIQKSRLSCFLIVASSFCVQIVYIFGRTLIHDRIQLVLIGKLIIALDCVITSFALLFTVGGSLIWQCGCFADQKTISRKKSVSSRSNKRTSSTGAGSPNADSATAVETLGGIAQKAPSEDGLVNKIPSTEETSV